MAASVPLVKRKRINHTPKQSEHTLITKEAISHVIRNNQGVYKEAGKEYDCSYTDAALIIGLVDLYGKEDTIQFTQTKEYYKRTCDGHLYNKLQSLVDQGFLNKIVQPLKANSNLVPFTFKWSFTTKAFDIWGFYYQQMMVKVNA
jgi:hypothetical protein